MRRLLTPEQKAERARERKARWYQENRAKVIAAVQARRKRLKG